MKPVALVTNTVPDYRREPFRLLDEAEGIEVIPYDDVGQRRAVRRLLGGHHRAVVAALGGRLALPGAYMAARCHRVPFVLWTALWHHPTTLAHRASELPTRLLYRHADAIVTYGPHVSGFVAKQRGTSDGVFVAPQNVDAVHFGRAVTTGERAAARDRAGAGEGDFLLLYVGRLVPEKGVVTLAEAWRTAALPDAVLAHAGTGSLTPQNALGHVTRDHLPALYAAADALVLPSVRTATFTEPWGLVVNEAMQQGTPVIATDSVGAAAGGLVQDGRNGRVVVERDASALAAAIADLAGDAAERTRLGDQARRDVAAYTAESWAGGMRAALRFVGASRQERSW